MCIVQDTNSHAMAPVRLLDTKTTLLCGITGTAVGYTHFFFRKRRQWASQQAVVSASRYVPMLQNCVKPELLQENILKDIVCKQVVAPLPVESDSSLLGVEVFSEGSGKIFS